MAAPVLVDTSFLVAFLSRRDAHSAWATAQSRRLPLPWRTCDAVLSETFHFLDVAGGSNLAKLLAKQAIILAFDLTAEMTAVLQLMSKYSQLPMSLADACLVRMTEQLPDSLLVTLDQDFRIYRRHGHKAIDCIMPG